jgi:glycosyltransferase involved in cell wall biosynthesis
MSTDIKSVLLLDLNCPKEQWKGHLPMYHKLIAKELLLLGFHVISVCPQPNFIQKYLEDIEGDITCYSYDNFRNITNDALSVEKKRNPHIIRKFFLKTSTKSIEIIKKIIKKTPIYPLIKRNVNISGVLDNYRYQKAIQEFSKYDKCVNVIIKEHSINKHNYFVLFPYIDIYFFNKAKKTNIDQIFQHPWYCLWVQTPTIGNEGINYLSIFKNNYCKGIGLLEENRIEFIRKLIPNKKTILFPDFAEKTNTKENYTLVQHIKYLAGSRIIIGLCGRLTEAKGIKTFLDAAVKAYKNNKNQYYFILVGSITCRKKKL